MTRSVFYLFALSFFLAGNTGSDKTATLTQTPLLVQTVTANHLQPLPLDQTLTERVWEDFLIRVDEEKLLFTEADVTEFKKYPIALAKVLQSGDVGFVLYSHEVYQASLERARQLCAQITDEELNLLEEQYLETNLRKRSYCADEKALKRRWIGYLKKRILNEWLPQKALATAPPKFPLPISTLLKARQQIDQKLDGLIKPKEFIEHALMKAYVAIHDVQSSYMSPEEKASWDASFARNFSGIGVHFQVQNGYPTILKVVEGGAASKSGKIGSGDVILAIGEAESTIDLIGKSSKEVRELLLGPTDSELLLHLRKPNQETEAVILRRAQIELSRASSAVFFDPVVGKKIGYLKLPRFYAGKYRSAAEVQTELQRLNAQSIDGLIVDLRDNQGGAVSQATQIIGYFLAGGPVMQFRYADGDIRVHNDPNNETLYGGPLTVLVNSKSSSASELLAGTLQAYKRAIVVGSRTYGKGSIQRFFPLYESDNSTVVGHAKLTIGAFYTANGTCTQYKGIQPDVHLPATDDLIPNGIRFFPNAMITEDLPPIKLSSQPYQVDKQEALLISSNSKLRLKKDLRFHQIEEIAKQKQAYDLGGSNISLEWNAAAKHYRKQIEQRNKTQNSYIAQPGFKATPLWPESASDNVTNNKKTQLEADPYLYESYCITAELRASGTAVGTEER